MADLANTSEGFRWATSEPRPAPEKSIHDLYMDLGWAMFHELPDSPEKSMAMSKLADAMECSNAALVRYPVMADA